MELLDGMLQGDKDTFSRICSRLIGNCFLCKSSSSDRSDYYFVLRYREKFQEYLEVLGYRLEINEEYGVVQLTNRYGYNHMKLKLIESIVLLILRILFDEKKRELSVSDEVIVTLGDIQDKYLSLHIQDKMIGSTVMSNTLHLFQRFQLVQLLDRDVRNEESRVLIYNSIAMAVRVEDIRQAYEKLEVYRKGKSSNEETDEDEADQLAPV